MKQGNQQYLEIQIYDSSNVVLPISLVSKVQFNIGTITKTYSETSSDVTYDPTTHFFKIWLTESETFGFPEKLNIDARILFKNNTIMGTSIEGFYVHQSLKKEPIL